MPDALAQALAAPGLLVLGLTYLAAGVVRGFTGFGTALIVVPVAGMFFAPQHILLLIAVTGFFSNILLVPAAWTEADRSEVGLLSLAAVLGVPVGLALIPVIEPTALRWLVSGIVAVTLLAVISGWQWRGRLGHGGLLSIGAGAGVVGGLTALTGPMVVMFYLANARKAVAVRANMILFLGALDILLIVNLMWRGWIEPWVIWFGVLMSVPYLIAIALGKAMFRPEREASYRLAAYGVVVAALVTGLPIWKG